MACMRSSAKLLCLIGVACVVMGCRPTAENLGDPDLAGDPARQGDAAPMPVVLASASTPSTAAPRVATLTMRGANRSIRKGNVLIPVIDREIEASLAPVLGAPFGLGLFDALPG